MRLTELFGLHSKKLAVFFILFLSVLLATHGPMVSYTSAQTVIDGEKVKQKVLKELDRRIAVQQKYLDSTKKRNAFINKSFERTIALDEQFNKNAPVKLNTDVTKKAYEDSKKRQQKSEEALQKTIDGLKALRNKVATTTSYVALQDLAKNTDAQYGLNRLVQVQSAVVAAVDNAKNAAQALQNVTKNHRVVLQSQFECFRQVGTATISEACKSYVSKAPQTSEEMNQQLNASLDRAEMRAKSFAAVADSAIVLLGAITEGFTNILYAKLGVKPSELNTLHQIGAPKIKTAAESVNGLFASLRSIVSQLSLANKMLEGASADLKSATISS